MIWMTHKPWDVTDCGYMSYIYLLYVYKLPMMLIQLSDSCDQSIIVIMVENHDDDSIQSCYHDILDVSKHG